MTLNVRVTIMVAASVAFPVAPAAASDTPDPASVTVVANFQSELGCPGDWQPDCTQTYLTYDAEDDVWQQSFGIPLGFWEYKAALNDSWDESYGAGGVLGGSNISLTLGHSTTVKFYYSHSTHWITDDRSSRIAVAVGNFQQELGCTAIWDPTCLRSWLQDLDADGVGSFSEILPAGSYEAKVTIAESWDESYGVGGVPGGLDIEFAVPAPSSEVLFTYDDTTHVLTIEVLSIVFTDGFENGGTSAWSSTVGDAPLAVLSEAQPRSLHDGTSLRTPR